MFCDTLLNEFIVFHFQLNHQRLSLLTVISRMELHAFGIKIWKMTMTGSSPTRS